MNKDGAARIAIIMDNPVRDLPGLVLVAMELCRRGAHCYLVPHNLIYAGKELPALAPDFVLLNYLRKNNEAVARRLIGVDIPFGILDTEGGVMTSMDSFATFMASDPDVRAKALCYCSWGPKLADHARRAGWYGREQIAVTGSPRFDFYDEPWRRAALAGALDTAAYPAPLVLVNSNFTLANPGFQTPDQEVDMYVARFGLARKLVLAQQQRHRDSMLALAELSNRVADRFPEATIVYRPHPFERLETYNELLEDRVNLHLVRSGSVDSWILKASAVIQQNCSTAIEAGFAGVPALSPGWIPKTAEQPLIEAVSIGCESEAAMFVTLESIFNNSFVFPPDQRGQLAQVVSDWFFKIDGHAHERVADRVLRSLPAVDPNARLKNCERLFLNNTTTLKGKARSYLVKALGLPTDWSFRKWRRVDGTAYVKKWDNSDKYFDAEQVKRIVSTIQEQAPKTFKPVKVGLAQVERDYHFGYEHGRSVALAPAPSPGNK